jgi:hypothetical protein
LSMRPIARQPLSARPQSRIRKSVAGS